MYNLSLMMLILIMISMIIMTLTLMMSKKTMYDREKNSPFECGFDPQKKSRLPFSIRFFMITIIFLIFDVEIVLMLPMIMTMNISNLKNWFWLSTYFIIILIMGLYYEWKFGSLNWLI